MSIGIIARDTDITKYCQVITLLGYKPVIINKNQEVDLIKGLIISGDQGDLENSFLKEKETLAKIRDRATSGMAVLGISAGVVLLSRPKPERTQPVLGIMDIDADAGPENCESFEAELLISALGPWPVQAYFQQAPIILACRPNVGIMALYKEKIVLARQGDFLACTFYPVLTEDFRIFEYFTKMVQDATF
jgi:5'-phosphate synthase pdxT subunit